MRKKGRRNLLINNSKGQVAIFVILVFHVLFLFFAMVINVGLLVHHKINLQNSVDLTAYYGAMKQAESLNAIAHINYQIRQSWKLLIFRYRHLGFAGAEDGSNGWVIDSSVQNRYKEISTTEDPPQKGIFCINYTPVSGLSSNENYCRISSGYDIPLPKPPSSISFPGFGFLFKNIIQSAQNLTINAIRGVKESCRYRVSINYYLLYRYLAAYKMDIANRKKLLIQLANDLSESSSDFKEIDGTSIRQGMEKTLLKNLTLQNKDSVEKNGFKIFNSLGSGDCKSKGGKNNPPGWLNENYIYPVFLTLDSTCEGNEHLKWIPQIANLGLQLYKPVGLDPQFVPILTAMSDYIVEPTSNNPDELLYKSSLGFEKDPWCAAYVGVSAKATPKIPFSPYGDVTLEARAFAKPFGGRIGPWYQSQWSPTSKSSDAGERIEPMSPPRVLNTQALDYKKEDLKDKTLEPDFSRYPGDKLGSKSYVTQAETARAIYTMKKIDLQWWDGLFDGEKLLDDLDSDGDILSWDKKEQKEPPMRTLELSFIAPDPFDLTYYSIDPHFYYNFIYDKIQKRQAQLGFNIRADLGARKKEKRLEGFSIKNQIDLITKPPQDHPVVYLKGRIDHFATAMEELLTSWTFEVPGDYSFKEDRFAKCASKYVIDPEKEPLDAAPGSCKVGGRTGYSVKMVNGEYLLQPDLDFGGGPKGAIKNPWSDQDL